MRQLKADDFYRGFDDLPRAAREVFAESRWLGMLQEWQICQIPRGSDIVERLREADRIMSCGNNAEAEFNNLMIRRLRRVLYLLED